MARELRTSPRGTTTGDFRKAMTPRQLMLVGTVAMAFHDAERAFERVLLLGTELIHTRLRYPFMKGMSYHAEFAKRGLDHFKRIAQTALSYGTSCSLRRSVIA